MSVGRRVKGYQLLGLAVFLLALLLIVLPALLVRGCNWTEESVQPQQQGKGRGTQQLQVKLQISAGKTVTMPLDDYLIGVVAAEMPVAFNSEALKAQAVAARTYTLQRLESKPVDDKHPDTPLCADSTHCQAWLSVAQMRKQWGLISFGRNYQKIAAAVRDTEGQVLVYQGKLIDPVYHASCGGLGTEDAAAVWGHSVAYLKSVPCRWDPQQRQQSVAVSFSLSQLCSRLGLDDAAVQASSGAAAVQVVQKTGSGRAAEVQVGNHLIKGTDLRKDLGLRSTSIAVQASGDKVTFLTRGYGHAVGMCQYGAQGMALKGRSYRQILTYYYSGVQLQSMDKVATE
jgi:stage II sporulation protein D